MQIFPRSLNALPAVTALATALLGGGVTFGIWYWWSPKFTQVGYEPVQPVEYSHRLHAGQLGIDCRYCHTGVERSPVAMVPPTQTCMNCHSLVRTDSARLEPIRQSWATGRPMEWIRIHRLPDHVYFDHSVHVTAGVGCVECHGRIDQMDRVRQVQPLSMGWCLECHRAVQGAFDTALAEHREPVDVPHIRPPDQVTNMDWQRTEPVHPARTLNPPQQCSGCHR